MQVATWLIAGKTHQLLPLSARAAEQDARHLLPIVEAHPFLATLLAWIGAPIVVVRRVTKNLRRKGAASGGNRPASQAG